jgi:hypothetical protein
MWMMGKNPAQITAMMVIASADRLTDVRHRLPEKKKDRGNQRACVADADPEHEVGDVECPADGVVQTPRPHAGVELVRHRNDAHGQHRQRDDECPPPCHRGFFL